jgi:hypothetical protein
MVGPASANITEAQDQVRARDSLKVYRFIQIDDGTQEIVLAWDEADALTEASTLAAKPFWLHVVATS